MGAVVRGKQEGKGEDIKKVRRSEEEGSQAQKEEGLRGRINESAQGLGLN